MKQAPTHTIKATGEQVSYMTTKHMVKASMLIDQLRIEIDYCMNVEDAKERLAKMTAKKLAEEVKTSLYVSGRSYFDNIQDKLCDEDNDAEFWQLAEERAKQLFPKFFVTPTQQ